MVLVHLLPTVGGFVLSFKRLNTFTFSRLFDAPWAGLENYRGILFDDANPLHSGFFGAVQNTAVYTFWTVGADARRRARGGAAAQPPDARACGSCAR